MTPKKLVLGTWLIDRVNIFFRIRRYIKWVAERWFILACCTVVGLGYATYLAFHTPNVYKSWSKIGIAPKINTPNQTAAQYMEELQSFYDTQLGFITGGKVLDRVSERTREHRPATPDERKVFKTMASKGPGNFTMEVESTSFDYAKLFAQIWAEEFLKFKNEMRGDTLGSYSKSKREEILHYEEKLAKDRKAFYDFQEKNKIGGVKEISAEQVQLEEFQAKYQDVKAQRQLLENQNAEDLLKSGGIASPKKDADSDQKKTAPETVDPLARFETGDYSRLKSQQKTKEIELAAQLTKLKQKHPYIVKLKQELALVNEQLKIELDLIEEKRLARIESLKKTEASYLPIIESLKSNVMASRSIQNEWEKLSEEVKNTKALVDNLKMQEQALNATQKDEGFFNISEAGAGWPQPVRPNRPKMVLSGLFLGIGVGLGLIYLLGRLDDRMELAEDIEAELEEPVLGQIPMLDLKELHKERVLITDLDEHNMFAESVRGARSAIMLGVHGDKKVLIITSAVPGDGKTTFTVNFAITLAIAGHRVLLVDADLRRGNVHNYFKSERKKGFTEVLTGELHWDDVVEDTEIETLQYVSTGKLPPNPGELLVSPISKQFIEEVRQSYDYIIFDCPPLTAIDDTFSLAGLADGLLFVVMSGQTSMRFAKNALISVRQRGAQILGVILNGIKADNPYYYYKHYYYNYYNQENPTSQQQMTALPLPAVKMASPKKSGSDGSRKRSPSAATRKKYTSIDAEARGLAGEKVSLQQITEEEQAKAEEYRNRRNRESASKSNDETLAPQNEASESPG